MKCKEGKCTFEHGELGMSACDANGYCYHGMVKERHENMKLRDERKYNPEEQVSAGEKLLSFNKRVALMRARYLTRFGIEPKKLFVGREEYEGIKETVEIYQGICHREPFMKIAEQFAGHEIVKLDIDNYIGFAVEWEDLKK